MKKFFWVMFWICFFPIAVFVGVIRELVKKA